MHAALALLLTFLLHSSLYGQLPGEVTPISLVGGNASLFLDFSQLDYELVLYPTVQGEKDSSRTFSYTVSGASVLSKPAVGRLQKPKEFSERAMFETRLRREEAILASQIRKRGGWSSPARKTAQPEQNSRSFTFSQFGGVNSDRTVRSSLVASNTKAVAYLDDNLAGAEVNISSSDLQHVLDRFTNTDYSIITDTFGDPSDVDGNGKVIFLFTPLVDQVGGVAGFFSSQSLFSEFDGGNGNRTDMMFIGLSHELEFYAPLLAHEFQHLISFNQHVLVRDGESEESWLNEGLSHHTEDLVDGHITGDLPRLYAPFLEVPENYSLIGDAGDSNGVRGTAYMFVRGLIETYGPGIAGRLVKTNRTGIDNVETETGRRFQDLFQTYVSRLFLSGTGLNSKSDLNYTLPFFTEPTSGKRSLPMPGEVGLSLTSTPISGRAKPLSPSYIRLMGTGGEASVTIQTEIAGSFGGVLIPIPREFSPQRVLKVDYFPQLTFDEPLQGQFGAGEGITIAGSVSDPDVSQMLFSFAPVGSPEEETNFYFDVTNNRFERSILFDPSQTGDFVLQIYMGREGEALPFIGRFSPVSVIEGSGEVLLPLDFFSGITLESILKATYHAGEGISFSGGTQDPTIELISLFFRPVAGGTEIRIDATVIDGQFQKEFVFFPAQAGTYNLEVFGGLKGGSLPFLGSFSPFIITTLGSEQVFIPRYGIEGVVFDDPPPTTYFANKDLRISGSVLDPTINQLVFRFDGVEGTSDQIDFSFDVTGGRFSDNTISFSPEHIGTYELVVFGGRSGQALPFLDSFKPVQVLSARASILLRQESLEFGIVSVGQTGTSLVTVVNVGSENLRLSGITSDDDQVSGPAVTIDISPGDSSVVRVNYRPSTPGPTSSTLDISTNDPSRRSVTVTLLGTGLSAPAPDLTLRNASVVFGEVEVGQSVEKMLVVVNSGTSTLEIGAMAPAGPPFTISWPTTSPAFTVAPGDSISVPVTFLPGEPGEYSETLTLKSNASDVQFTLMGKAVAPPIVGVPVGFYPGVAMDSPLPFSYISGEPVHISGLVADVDVTWVFLSFAPIDGSPGIFFGFDVINGRFDRSIIFHPSQAGDYDIALFMGQKGGSVPFLAAYSSVSVAVGQDEVRLPPDYFSRVTLNTPLSTTLVVDKSTRIRGTVSDSSVSEILFRFDLNEDPDQKHRFFSDVVNGVFDVQVTIDSIGEYTLGLYMGEKGGSLPIVGRFSPLSIVEAPPPSSADFDSDGDVDFADFISFAGSFGSSLGDTRFNSKFDLDGNQTIGFSDFVNFSREYGN
jgi:hypothetical protein